MIIGLTGMKRSGKNTAAEFIEKNFSDKYTVCEHSFAGKLKQSALAAITGEIFSEKDAIKACESIKERTVFKMETDSEEEDFADVLKKFGFSGREYLQWYGTEAHRKIFGADFWTDIVLNEIYDRSAGVAWEEILDVITDVRFPDEAKAITYMGGKIARINRPGTDGLKDSHISEQGIPTELVNVEIWNDGSIEQFEVRVIDAAREVISWQQ